MTDSRPRVRGVVLAGGRSTRFGDEDKALATLGGRPLVARAVDAVAEVTDGRPLLSVATDAQADRLLAALADSSVDGDRAVETVRDADRLSGPLAGIDAAARAAEAPWLFVCACDMPLVTPESVEAVTGRLPSAEGGAAAVVPVVDGYDQPLHACYRREALGAALADLVADDALMALLDRLTVERVPADHGSALASATTNVNTQADLRALRESEE